MQFRSYLVLVLGFCLALPLPAQGNRRDEIVARGILRVGTTGDYPPFSYRTNAASPFVGLDIQLAVTLAKTLGVRLILVPTSWSNLMPDFNRDQFDIAMGGVSINAERQRTAFFSLPYLRDGKTPIARCEDQTRYQTLTQIDRHGVRVVVNPGGTNERFVRAHLRQATIVMWTDNLTIFDQVVAGAADLMITDAIETRLQQKLRPQLCAVHPDAPFDDSQKAYLLPRDVQWQHVVDEWLRPLVESGEIARLLDKWLEHPWPRAAPAAIRLEPLGRLIAERLGVMTDVARYKWNHKAAIEDLIREQQIIDGLQQEAEALGVPAVWARRFFRAQIEAAKVIQREHFARWQQSGEGAFPDAPDLATVTRPRLDALTPQLLRELAIAWPALADPAQQPRIAATAQRLREAAGGRADATEMALAPLTDGSASTLQP